jgi:FkbM family methyltransferase
MDISKIQDNVVTIQGYGIIIDPDIMSPVIVGAITSGGYEGTECNLIKKYFAEGDKVLEVGGAIGLTTMVAASIVGQANIFSFEANPHLIEVAQNNFRYNSFNISNFNGVLKNRYSYIDENQYSDFYISQDYWASSLQFSNDALECVKIKQLCLEEQFEKHNINALVCDIEGGEFDLLALADLSNITKIVIELHYENIGKRKIDTLIRKITSEGFMIDISSCGYSVAYFHR